MPSGSSEANQKNMAHALIKPYLKLPSYSEILGYIYLDIYISVNPLSCLSHLSCFFYDL